MLQTSKEDKTTLQTLISKLGCPEPDIKISIYKNRRGQYKDILLWCEARRGVCRINPLFATDYNYNFIDMPDVQININSNITSSAF